MSEMIFFLAEGAGYAEPSALGMTATAWVSLSMLAFIGILLWKKVPALVGSTLDKQIAEIKTQLDEAKELRGEAEKLRAEYEAKMASAITEAEDMKDRAEQEAELILEQAKTDATALVERRKKMAEDKIAAAERAAISDIRRKVANAASAASAKLISDVHDASADKVLVDETIASLGNQLN